ncbi:hypothetical protein EU527_06825 [Candidatus Thorarchaeota archaeon]|nr:MAG: hypothetical protein EU527_06825 [Candidatus Thorarchaeota archaeon]
MRAIHRVIISLLILVTLFLTPNTVWGSTTTSDTSRFGVSASLLVAIAASQPNDILAVVAQFPIGSTPGMMVESILSSGIPSITIRHAFHLIPMVSLYIESRWVEDLVTRVDMIGLTLDAKRKLAVETPYEEFIISSNGDGYTHFTKVIDAEKLWAQGINGSGIVVAVLDSGADGEHPDLQNKIIDFKDYINDRDDNDPSDGMDAYDDNGHGTACAWNVAGDGSANGGDFTGVAPGADLLIIKVLDDDGAGDDSVIAQGIEYAVDNGADIISLSLGGFWADETYLIEPSVVACKQAVEVGISVVIAAGNSGPQAFSINSPGIVEEAITVGSSTNDKGVVAFSSVGPVLRTIAKPLGYTAKPDIVAPGYQVVSGRSQDANPYEYLSYNASEFQNTYTQWSGTSASTPIVAGAIALLAQNYSLLTPEEIKTSLMFSAKDLALDPMVQGWGLINVTAASQTLAEYSRDITIMTPRRFPTLPWSSKVLIVGDDRQPQNITIISTHSIGTSTIAISGNASEYINTNVEQISVIAGYSHFGIWLEIPKDLPLTEVGQYTGQLALMKDDETITSIDLRFTITLFGGRLMVDMEHHATGLLEGDVDDPSYYGYFTEYLRGQGVVLTEFGNPNANQRSYIDIGTLSAADIFMIMDTETAYTSDEISALHEFVENGGTLIVLAEFWDAATSQASYAIDDYNLILQPFGIQCERRGIGVGPGEYGEVFGPSTGSIVENDTLMEGVESLYIILGSTLSVNSSIANARGLFWEDSDRNHAIVATAEYGSGHVYVIGDGSTLYDDILYDAIQFGADNLRMLRNLASAIVPDAPRIYDVILEKGDFGEPANVTAFVFDDDLDVVSMSIIGPLGTNITGSVTESLGYKFSTTFVFNSGGFYSFRVTAIDDEGNVKIFQKTILVPVDAAEDFFVQAVTYSLLGIVASGIIYAGYQRYGVGRRAKRRDESGYEEEWEVPPPSIE